MEKKGLVKEERVQGDSMNKHSEIKMSYWKCKHSSWFYIKSDGLVVQASARPRHHEKTWISSCWSPAPLYGTRVVCGRICKCTDGFLWYCMVIWSPEKVLRAHSFGLLIYKDWFPCSLTEVSLIFHFLVLGISYILNVLVKLKKCMWYFH